MFEASHLLRKEGQENPIDLEKESPGVNNRPYRSEANGTGKKRKGWDGNSMGFWRTGEEEEDDG